MCLKLPHTCIPNYSPVRWDSHINNNHKLLEKIARSSPQKMYCVSTSFLSHSLVFTSDQEYVHTAVIFRTEVKVPERPGAESLVWLMEKHGFGTGLVIYVE